jgi:DNA-binding GntR family transcriptional regulator
MDLEQLPSVQIERTSTAAQVAEALRGLILGGELAPGTSLTEVKLATAFGTSRNTIREALQTLVWEGLATQSAQRPAVVTRLSTEDVRDIFRVRRTVELTAIDASARATPEQLEALRATVERIATLASGDLTALVEADVRFHRALVALIGSPRLDRMFGQLASEMRLCMAVTDHPAAFPQEEIVAEHRELYELIAAGERARCRKLLLHHLDESERRIEAALAALGDGDEPAQLSR